MKRSSGLFDHILPHGPKTLVVAMFLGAVTTVVAMAGAISGWRAIKPSLSADEQRFFGSKPGEVWSCENQLEVRRKKLEQITSSLDLSELRRKQLNNILVDPGSPHFLGARAEIEREEQLAAKLNARRETLRISADVWPQAGIFVMGAIFSLLITRHVLKRAAELRPVEHDPPPAGGVFAGWWSWWIATVTLVAGTMLAGQYLTSATVEKTWFGHDSYCISPKAFWSVKLAFIGNQMMVGCAVAVFGCMSRPDLVPAIDLDRPRAGVGEYVDFARTSLFWGMLSALGFVCYWLWLAFSGAQRTFGEKVAYGLPALAAAVPVTLVLWRFMQNMDRLQCRYAEAIEAQRSPTEPRPLPVDPTLPFFQDTPWKLPSAVAGLVAVAWVILEATGVKQALFGN